MQADVQRTIHQQGRMEQGVRSGRLTNKEIHGWNRGRPVLTWLNCVRAQTGK